MDWSSRYEEAAGLLVHMMGEVGAGELGPIAGTEMGGAVGSAAVVVAGTGGGAWDGSFRDRLPTPLRVCSSPAWSLSPSSAVRGRPPSEGWEEWERWDLGTASASLLTRLGTAAMRRSSAVSLSSETSIASLLVGERPRPGVCGPSRRERKERAASTDAGRAELPERAGGSAGLIDTAKEDEEGRLFPSRYSLQSVVVACCAAEAGARAVVDVVAWGLAAVRAAWVSPTSTMSPDTVREEAADVAMAVGAKVSCV